MSLRIKDANLIEQLDDFLMFAVGNTREDADGAVTLGQTKDFIDADKAQVAFTGSYLNLTDTPNLESYVLMTTLQQNYYNKNQINQIISGISGPIYKKVEELPEVGENNVIYLLPQEGSGQQNIFDEYIWIPDGRIFEKIGSTEADFENYYTISEVDALIPSVYNSTITFQQGGVTKGTITLNQSSAATINFDESYEQEQADWNQSDPTAVDYIKNKPTIPTVNDSTVTFTQYGVTKGTFTLNQSQAETIELDGQVQADWEQEDNTEPDYIKNKPDTLSLIFTYEDSSTDLIDFYVKDIEHIYDYMYIKNEYNGQNTITLITTKNGSPTVTNNTIQYSKNKIDWTELTLTEGGSQTINMEVGEVVFLRNEHVFFNHQRLGSENNSWYTTINCSHEHSVGGKLDSLVYGWNSVDGGNRSGFCNLFLNDTTLIDASKLILPNGRYLCGYCYSGLFEGCTSLVNPPEEIFGNWNTTGTDTNLGHCRKMFKDCTSLISSPIIPNHNTVDEYKEMFRNCSSLVTPPTLPTVSMSSHNYYYMFAGCSSMTTAPNITQGTISAYACQGMFSGCVSLVNPPVMNSSISVSNTGCSGMFSGCTSLTSTPTTTITVSGRDACKSMFNGCISLVTNNVQLNSSVGNECFTMMYKNCSSMTSAPVLPATTVPYKGYLEMFKGCSLIDEITIYADDISATGCLSDWLDGVVVSGTFHNLGSAVYPSGASGIPTGWTEVNS